MTDKPKRPRDANQLAKFIVDLATGEDVTHEQDTSGQRKGGLEGGPSRARHLSEKERQAIAKKGAEVRWGKAHLVPSKKEHS